MIVRSWTPRLQSVRRVPRGGATALSEVENVQGWRPEPPGLRAWTVLSTGLRRSWTDGRLGSAARRVPECRRSLHMHNATGPERSFAKRWPPRPGRSVIPRAAARGVWGGVVAAPPRPGRRGVAGGGGDAPRAGRPPRRPTSPRSRPDASCGRRTAPARRRAAGSRSRSGRAPSAPSWIPCLPGPSGRTRCRSSRRR